MVPVAVGAPALPVGQSEGGYWPVVTGSSGRESGDRAPGCLAGGTVARRLVPALPDRPAWTLTVPTHCCFVQDMKKSGVISVGGSRRRLGIRELALMPGAASRGQRGAGPRGGGGAARPGTTGTRSQGSRSISALGKRQHGNKMAGKGWDCHGEPCREVRLVSGSVLLDSRSPCRRLAEGWEVPPGLFYRPAPPPGRAPVEPQLQKMAARRSPLNPAMGGGGTRQ